MRIPFLVSCLAGLIICRTLSQTTEAYSRRPVDSLTPAWIGQIPNAFGLKLSAVKSGFALGIGGDDKIPVRELDRTHFSVFVVNLSARQIALNKHRGLLWIALYDSKGDLVTDREKDRVCLGGPDMMNLAVLEPGEVLSALRLPSGIAPGRVPRGTYTLRAILDAPRLDSWPSGSVPLFKRDNVILWHSDRLISPEHRVVLE
jgi:hypothetical protein